MNGENSCQDRSELCVSTVTASDIQDTKDIQGLWEKLKSIIETCKKQ